MPFAGDLYSAKLQRHRAAFPARVISEIRMPRARSGAAITTPRKRRVTPKEYRAAFAARVRHARIVARYPLDEMALLLGITKDTYAKYEGRGASLMPHNLIVPFCLACRVSVEWLLTGIGPTRSR